MYRSAPSAPSPSRRSSPPQRHGSGAVRAPRWRRLHAAQLLLAALAALAALRTLLRPAGRAVQPARDDDTNFELSCYVGTSDAGGALGTVPLTRGRVCARYLLRCAAPDAAAGVCTDDEAEEGHEKRVFTQMDAAACEQLRSAGAYHGRYTAVRCCDHADLCNAPASGGGDYTTGGEEDGVDGFVDGTRTRRSAARRAVRCATGARGGSAAVVPADGGRCVRYGTPCDSPDDPGCDAAGVARGALRLVIGTASAADCADWAAQPELYRQLLCCAEERCNDGRGGGFGGEGVAAEASPPPRRHNRDARGHGAGVRRAAIEHWR